MTTNLLVYQTKILQDYEIMSKRGPYNDRLTKSVQFTKINRLEVYPEIDPKGKDLSQEGKVVIVTGASQGLGRDVSSLSI